MTANTFSVSPILGMNNRLPHNKLRTKEGSFVADAVNVDILPGVVKARPEPRKILTGTAVHSLWENYYVDGANVYRVLGTIDAASSEIVFSGVAVGLPVAFERTALGVCISDSNDIWVLDTGEQFGVPTPTTKPVVAAVAGGGFSAGWYQVTTRYRRDDGECSGATQPVSAYLVAGQALEISNVSTSAGLVTELFVTSANGTRFFYAGDVVSDITLSTRPVEGKELDTLSLTRLPPGRILREYYGRLFSVSGRFVYYTEAWSTLHNPVSGFLSFPVDITVFEPCTSGVFIAADATYWLSGAIGTDAMSLTEVLPYGAAAYSSGKITNSKDVFWMGDRGIVIGHPDGTVDSPQEASTLVHPAHTGAGVLREYDGARRITISTFSPRSTNVAAGTYMDVEVVHTIPTQ